MYNAIRLIRSLGQIFTIGLAVLVLLLFSPNLYGQSMTTEGPPKLSVGAEATLANAAKTAANLGPSAVNVKEKHSGAYSECHKT